MVQGLEGTLIEDAMQEIQRTFFDSFEEMVKHQDDIICYLNCDDMTDVARYLIEETGMLGEVPHNIHSNIDCDLLDVILN